MTLFDHAKSEQDRQIERVEAKIAESIVDFCANRTVFYGDELRKYVFQHVGLTSPESPGRILRLLRKRGVLNYRCASRTHSLYEVIHK